MGRLGRPGGVGRGGDVGVGGGDVGVGGGDVDGSDGDGGNFFSL